MTTEAPVLVGFVICAVPDAVTTRLAAPVEVGFVTCGAPDALRMRSATPVEVGLVILGEPDAVMMRKAAPDDVGLATSGAPVAVRSAVLCVTVTAIQPTSPLFVFSTPRNRLPVGAPAGSLNVIEVPSAATEVTVISVAPLRVSVVFNQTFGHLKLAPVAVGLVTVGLPDAVLGNAICAEPVDVGLVTVGVPDVL